MKSVYLSFLFVIFYFSDLHSQSITLGSKNPKDKNEFIKGKVIKASKEGYWVLYSGDISSLTLINKNYYIESYDANMNFKTKVQLECPTYGGHEYDMDNLILSGDDILLLVSYENKDSNKTDLKLIKLNKDGSISNTIKKEWFIEGIRYDKYVAYSPDSSSFAIIVSVLESRKDKIMVIQGIDIDKKALKKAINFNYWVINKEKELFAQRNLEIDYEGLKFVPIDFLLNSSNDLFLVIDYELGKTEENKKFLNKTDIWKVNSSNGKMDKLIISRPDKYCFNMKFNWLEEGNIVEIVGSVNEKDDPNTMGIFYATLNTNIFSNIEMVASIFPDKAISSVSNLYKNKNSLTNFSLNEVVTFAGNRKLLIFEYTNSSIYVSNVVTYTPRGNSSFSGSNTPGYIYGDIFLVFIDNKGNIQWTDVIRKENTSYGPRYPTSDDQKYFRRYLNSTSRVDFSVSYLTIKTNNSVSLVFHDYANRTEKDLRTYAPTIGERSFPNTVLHSCTFNENGYAGYKSIFNQKEYECIIGTGLFIAVPNGLILYSYNKKYYQWVKVMNK